MEFEERTYAFLFWFALCFVQIVILEKFITFPSESSATCGSWRMMVLLAALWSLPSILLARIDWSAFCFAPAIFSGWLFVTLYQTRIRASKAQATLEPKKTKPRRIWVPITPGEAADLRFLGWVTAVCVVLLGWLSFIVFEPDRPGTVMMTIVVAIGIIAVVWALCAAYLKHSWEVIGKKFRRPRSPQQQRRGRSPRNARPANP